MKQWYTLHTKPKKEYQVATMLRQRQFRVYLPEIEATRASTVGNREPFFPGYLFIKVDLEAVGLSDLQWIPGLRRVVAFDGRPAPVSGEIIDLIRYKLGNSEADGTRPEHTYSPGDAVRLKAGPFRGMLAIFERATRSAERVRVLLNVLGASRVQIDVADLDKADAEIRAPKRRRRTRGRGRRIIY